MPFLDKLKAMKYCYHHSKI